MTRDEFEALQRANCVAHDMVRYLMKAGYTMDCELLRQAKSTATATDKAVDAARVTE